MQRSLSVLAPAEHDEAFDWRTLALGIAALLAQPPEPHPDTLSEVARQLKEPVATLRAHAARLVLQATNEIEADAAREVAARIVEQADLVSDWVSAILDVQRIQLGKLHLDLCAADLTDLVARVAAEFGAPVIDDDNALPVRADCPRLRQALRAVLNEAVESFGADMTVRLTARPWPDGRERAVLTLGAGGDERRTSTAPFNVNLYVARELVRLHGGELWAEPHGGGATLVLPLDFSPDSHTVLAQRGSSSPTT
jgi:K+-sensing histidine kinase KdpD